MALCQSCRTISFADPKRETKPQNFWGETYHFSTFAILQPSLKALYESANSGCPLCSKFWAVIYGSEAQIPGDDASLEVVLLCYYKENNEDWLLNGSMWLINGEIERCYHAPVLPISSKYMMLLACE
jgi:hypothetical protein